MSRIFKNSTFKMQLLVADDINTSIDGLSFKFHTTDPNIYVEVFDNYTLKANIAILTIGSTLFSALDEGVLTYEVRGYFNGEYVTIERQSNYFLKYSNSIPQVNLQEKNVDIIGNGYYEIYPDEGYNGMSKVNVNVDIPAQGGGSCKLTTLEATENGTYFPPTTSFLVFDGDDVFDFAYADTRNAIEISFKVNGSGWIFGNNEKVGLFAESTDYITVYWFGYSGHYTINNGEVNTIVIKPYDSDTPIILNGGGYGISEREIDNTDTTEIPLGGGNFDFCYAKFWSDYTSYLNGETPLFYYLPNSDGNIKRSLLGGDFEVFSNRGSGVCQYTEISEFVGFSRVDVNVETTTEGGGSCNLGHLYAEFKDRLDGDCWWYADEQGFDGFNYVSINANTYGSQKYNQGYQDGKNASQNAVEFEYIEPNQVVDMVLNQGFTGNVVIKGQITEVQSIDLNYGNATYFLGDLKVFRGTGLNNNSIIEEDYFQVGDWVVIVGNVSNYNGTAQVDKGSTLVAKWRETPVTENKWGITGYFNNWGGTPDIYFEDPGFQLSFMGEMKDVRVVYGFETDGQEIKIRYNNQWNYSYSAEIYDIPQIRPLIISDMNMDLVEGKYDIYLLGYNGDEKFEPEYILFMPKDEDISLYNLSDYVNVMNPRAPLLLTVTNEFNGEVYSTTESKMSFLAQLGCYFALRQELDDGTIKEGTMVYDGVTTDYLFNV